MNIVLALFIIVLIADTTSLSRYRHSIFGLVILQSRILSNSHGVLSAYANAEYVFQFLNILQQIIIMIVTISFFIKVYWYVSVEQE